MDESPRLLVEETETVRQTQGDCKYHVVRMERPAQSPMSIKALRKSRSPKRLPRGVSILWPLGSLLSVLTDTVERHHTVNLTVLERLRRLSLQHGMGVQFVHGAAAGSGEGRLEHLENGRQLVVN
jgi:hypothetical protein